MTPRHTHLRPILTGRQAKLALPLLAAFAILALVTRRCNTAESQPEAAFTRLEGSVFHTWYHIQYADTVDYHADIKSLFAEFDNSLSMFNEHSLLTRINQGDTTAICDDYMLHVLSKAYEVSRITNGAFDMTVAPLVNLWGFGFRNADNVTQQTIDSIMQFVGYQKTRLLPDGRLEKDDSRTILDASSIAKGYMCDVVADFLKAKGISDFMVEIGGEIACSGTNSKGSTWSIGINKPSDDSLCVNQQLQDILRITDCGVATSGNYRRFYVEGGQRYGHIINPHTGYPAQQDILSSTVIAPDCMTADAYATSFMVMGSKMALRVLEADTTLMAYFICSTPDDCSKYNVIYSPKLRQMLDSQQP